MASDSDSLVTENDPPPSRLGSQDQGFLQEVGNRVRSARKRHGMSRKVLARESGVSERYLAQLETGSGNISILLLRQVAAATGMKLRDLVSESQEDAPEILSILELARRASPAQREDIINSLTGMLDQSGTNLKASRIALIGLRGAGKSTLGKLIAEDLKIPFIELNREIELDSGLAIAEIFALYGQDGYRRLEQRCLRSVIDRHSEVVLAVAGGIVAEANTYEMLLRSFHSVWLQARPEEHMERVRAQGDRRPMAGNPAAMNDLRSILESRQQLYANAEMTFNTSGKTVAQCRDELSGLLVSRVTGSHS
ncbi:helix-turn-helix transcriptional regulator [Denitrobaculum tricleocarpae]|uniref:Shikimate kinase n=1 Tax=Denitrobaculum tricleocarpae TaxID=2591009 RepID=A0A545TQP6_9PROT|nr:helix-turn-helix transcriptional regulator [Denitrobaculum tricleocarpae]TQV79546.1 helix-turn-helix domain-containing protein [Denitrobaculum tricleocarpae]